MIKILPYPLTPCWVKGQIFKFCNNSVICQYFLLKFHMQTEVQKYETYQTCFLSKVPTPWVDLGGGVKRSKFNFQNMVMMHIKLKGIWYAATLKQTLSPQSPPSPHPDPGGGSLVQFFFQNMVMLYIKLNGTTIAATW